MTNDALLRPPLREAGPEEEAGPGAKVFVAEAYPTVRRAFVQRVYVILAVQIAFTAAGVWVVRAAAQGHEGALSPEARSLVFWASFLLGFGVLLALSAVSKQYPLNLALLGLFTLCETAMLSVALLDVPADLLARALAMTCSAFVGLSVYAVQEKMDFTFLRSYLFASLWLLLSALLWEALFPASDSFQLIVSWFGALLFCGYIVYDTYLLHHKLYPDQYVFAAVSLYLDFINLFLHILRIMSRSRR